MFIDPFQRQKCPKGIKPLVFSVLQSLWWEHGYVSNFTVHTMRRV